MLSETLFTKTRLFRWGGIVLRKYKIQREIFLAKLDLLIQSKFVFSTSKMFIFQKQSY